MFRGSNSRGYWEKKHVREYINSPIIKYKDLDSLSYTKVATDILIENKDEFFNKSVLDLGCADGKTLAIMKSQVPDFTYEGWDFSETAIKAARKKNENICFRSEDFLLNSIKTEYGLICMFEVLEHITSNNRTNFSLLDDILKHCEYCIISTVNTTDNCFGEHISHYTYNTFDTEGYEIIWKSYLNEINMPDGIYHYMIFIIKGEN